jgi:hypothetical protein
MMIKALVSMLALLMCCWSPADAASPQSGGTPTLARVEGRLTLATGEARTGRVVLVASVYAFADEATPLWVEQQTVTLDAAGRYALVVGATLPDGVPKEVFLSGTGRWIGVAMLGEPEQPRIQLVAVPYALKAAAADTLAGRSATDFVLAENLGERIKTAMAAQTGIASSESKGAGTSGAGAGTNAISVNALVKYTTAGGVMDSSLIYESGGILTVNGLGSHQFLADGNGDQTLWIRNLNTGALARSVLNVSAGTVANYLIGYGSGNVGGLSGLGGEFAFYTQGVGGLSLAAINASGAMRFYTGGTVERARLTPAGRFGVGTTTPGGMLHAADVASGVGVYGSTTTGGESIFGVCLTANTNCWAIYGGALAGDRAAVLYGGRGVFAGSTDANYPGLDASSGGAGAHAVNARAYGATSYGLYGVSDLYRGAYINSNVNTSWYPLYVEGTGNTSLGAYVGGNAWIAGNLTVNGSKTGYVVDIMQNQDSAPLEPGDVVVIVGSSAPVVGQIPVVNVKRATSAHDTGAVGVVDEAWYAPDAVTKAAYEAQEQAVRAAMAEQRTADAAAAARGGKAEAVRVAMPERTISDAVGMAHAVPDAAGIDPGGYLSVVTLGSYKQVKVDASFGAIHAGDLLTTSSNPGYAMKVTDKVAAIGAIIGKALGNLESGTGTIAVMVMPR